MYRPWKESMSQGLKPDFLPFPNVRTEVRTYLRSNSKGGNNNSIAIRNLL
jgi:hypothetical protein